MSCFDAFSSREPVPIPDQVQDRLSLENASGAALDLKSSEAAFAACTAAISAVRSGLFARQKRIEIFRPRTVALPMTKV